MNVFQKQPADQLDYDLDFSDWITAGDIITGAAAISSDPTKLTILSTAVLGQVVKVWLSGGENGATYKVTTTISTQQGRIKELDFKVRVREI